MDTLPFTGVESGTYGLSAMALMGAGVLALVGSRRTCDHATTVTIGVAGIERVVCESCGKVTLVYDHDFVQASATAEAHVARFWLDLGVGVFRVDPWPDKLPSKS